jgi:drug/metabolite transporter (DMT)-like permease
MGQMAAILFAVLSSLCFGIALVTGRVGLRALDARSGAAISVPTATLLFIVAAPFALDVSGFSIEAGLLFAAVGLFFPAIVTILTFSSNERLGPTVTSAVSGTAPLFALLAAGLFLAEQIPAAAALAAVGVAAGIAVLSWDAGVSRSRFGGWALLWPLAGAVLRGIAQVAAKAGLLLWPNPFAAGLIGYIVSSGTVIGADRLRGTAKARPTMHSVIWFGATGLLNGSAVLSMYAALSIAPVSLVAPIVAAYPMVTALLSGVILRDEALSARVLAGGVLTVAAIVYLVVSTSGR